MVNDLKAQAATQGGFARDMIKEICLQIELLLKAKHLVFKVEILTELDF